MIQLVFSILLHLNLGTRREINSHSLSDKDFFFRNSEKLNNMSERQKKWFNNANIKFSDRKYWRQIYEDRKTQYEWYENLDTVYCVFQRHLSISAGGPMEPMKYATDKSVRQINRPDPTDPNFKALYLGVGSSNLAQRLSKEVHMEKIVSVDLARKAIDFQREHYGLDFPKLSFFEMDLLDNKVVISDAEDQKTLIREKDILMKTSDKNIYKMKDESFDLIFEKGTIDCLYCSGIDFKTDLVTRGIDELYRLLKPGGILMIITYGKPMMRHEITGQCDGEYSNRFEGCWLYRFPSIHKSHTATPVSLEERNKYSIDDCGIESTEFDESPRTNFVHVLQKRSG